MVVRFLILIVFSLSPSITQASAGANAAGPSNVAAQPPALTEKSFLDIYEPDKNKCRPALRAGENNEPIISPSLLSSFEGSIACMLKGEKKVYWSQLGESEFSRLFSDLKGLRDLLAAKNFAYFKFLNGNFVIFSPEGKNYALLFAKMKMGDSMPGGTYSMGTLLGYPDQDSKAFHIKVGGSEEGWRTLRQESIAWLVKNAPGIEMWAAKHLKIHNFEKNQSSAKESAAMQEQTTLSVLSQGSAGSAAAPACTAQKGATAAFDLKKIEEELLRIYSPDGKRCGPSYQAQYGHIPTITDSVEGALACIIKGYRTRTFSGGLLSPEMKALAASKKITITPLRGEEFILFAEQARKEGLLLGKLLSLNLSEESHDPSNFNYLFGHLLGYSDADMSHETAVKQYAQAWIKKNEIDLEQWAAKNLSLYSPSQAAQKQAASGAVMSIKDFNTFLFSIYMTLSEQDRMEMGSDLLAIYDQLSPADQKEAVAMMHTVGLDFETERQKILSSSVKAKTETQEPSASSQTAAAGCAATSKKK